MSTKSSVPTVAVDPVPSPYVIPEKLWFEESAGTNYQVWKAHILQQFGQHQGLLGFIDGSCSAPPETVLRYADSKTVKNPEYDVWTSMDQSVKKGISALLEHGVAPVHLLDDVNKTSRDLWLYLEDKFQQHLLHQQQNHPTSSASGGSGQNTRRIEWKNDLSTLYRAVGYGDWHTAKEILFEKNDDGTETLKINSPAPAAALHFAVGFGKNAILFVEKLVELSKPYGHDHYDFVAAKDTVGNTALSNAAAVGNHAAATIMVNKKPDLLYVSNILGDFPVHIAAKHAKRDMLIYLISETKDDRHENPYAGFSGISLVISSIQAECYDIALYLLRKYPKLAILKLSSNSALKAIAEMDLRTNSGSLASEKAAPDMRPGQC